MARGREDSESLRVGEELPDILDVGESDEDEEFLPPPARWGQQSFTRAQLPLL